MRRHLIAFLMAALSVGLAVTLYAAVTVPAGTAIIMSLDQSVSSKDARTGQKVDCSVAQDVTVGGEKGIPKGAKGSRSGASGGTFGSLKKPAQRLVEGGF